MSTTLAPPIARTSAGRAAGTGNYFVAAYPPFSCWQAEQVPAVLDALDRPAPAAPLGLYFHLPFCQQKCHYCYFLSYVGQSASVVHGYLDSLTAELLLYSRQRAIKGRPLAFAYFGGGTPSMLSLEQLRHLMGGLKAALPWEGVQEVTFECAPRSLRSDFLAALREAGVTRLSMGVQSFSDVLLKLNGRVHLAEDVMRAFGCIQDVEFPWVNLDLMVGMIGETDSLWQDSVRRAIALSPDSVTIYQMEIPHNTQLYRDLKAGHLPNRTLSWELKRHRHRWAFAELERAGYTIASAYMAVKDPARHRFLYQDHLWCGGDMLGLGVASFGYVGGVHYQNATTLEEYQRIIASGTLPLRRARHLSRSEQLVREFILQLKLGAVPAAPFRERFGVEITSVFAEPLAKLARQGWLNCSGDEVRLTRRGLLRADRLLTEFYAPEFRGIRYS